MADDGIIEGLFHNAPGNLREILTHVLKDAETTNNKGKEEEHPDKNKDAETTNNKGKEEEHPDKNKHLEHVNAELNRIRKVYKDEVMKQYATHQQQVLDSLDDRFEEYRNQIEKEFKAQDDNSESHSGQFWSDVFVAAGLPKSVIPDLELYETTRYKENSASPKPIHILLWCPIKESIVTTDPMSTTKAFITIDQLKQLLEDQTELKDRLVSVRNINPSLCTTFWAKVNLGERPDVYQKVLDQLVSEIGKDDPSKTTTVLVMCGNFNFKGVAYDTAVQTYLKQKVPELKVEIAGHPSTWEGNRYGSLDHLKKALGEVLDNKVADKGIVAKTKTNSAPTTP